MDFGLFMAVWEDPEAGNDHRKLLDQVVDYIIDADRLGYSSVFLTEHHFTGLAQIPAALTLLANVAGRTNQIRLGTGVTILPWHNPITLAEQVATVDLLSHGRFDFGVGRGFRYAECKGFNIPAQELQERYDETIEILEKCWANGTDRFDHHGKHWTFENVVIDPVSIQQPHVPVWVSADSPSSIRRVAVQGYNLLLGHFTNLDHIADRIKLFRETLVELGRDPASQKVGVTRAFSITDTVEQGDVARRRHKVAHANNRSLSVDPNIGANSPLYKGPVAHTDDAYMIGRKDEVIAQLRRLEAAGADTVLLMDLSAAHDVLRRVADEIMPLFGHRRSPAAERPELALAS